MPAPDLIERLPRHLKLGELRVFAAVLEHQSFRKAAAALHITQPAVTKAIGGLEAVLGVRLFDRNAAGVEPTVYGLSLAPHAAAIFGELKSAAQALDVVASGAKGALRVGTVPLPGVPFLPIAIAHLAAAYPDIFVTVTEANERELVERLKKRDIELAIFRLPHFNPGRDLAVEVLFEERLAVMAARDHPLAGRQAVSWDELLGHRWVSVPADSYFADHVRRNFSRLGMEMPRHFLETSSIPFLHAMVLHGGMLSLGLRSQHAFSPAKDFLVQLPVGLPPVIGSMAVAVLKGREPGPLAQRLLGAIRDLLAARLGAPAVSVPPARRRARRA